MKRIETVLGEMATLATLKATATPEALEHWRSLLSGVLEDERKRWIREDRAMRRSGKPVGWFVRRRRAWAAEGFAEKRPDGWYYYLPVVPTQHLAREVSDDGAEQARRDHAALRALVA